MGALRRKGDLLPYLHQFVAYSRCSVVVLGGISTAALTCPSDPIDGWTNRWIESKHKSDFGKFVLSAGKFYGNPDKDKGKSLGMGDQVQEDFWRKHCSLHSLGIPKSRAGGESGESCQYL